MNLEEFLSHFDVRSCAGGDWKVLCPSHPDRNPSLSVTEKDGKVVWFCHAGCSQEDVLAAMGLTFADVNGRDEPEAVYPYHDERGELLYEVLRKPGKQFPQRHQDPETGEWVWDMTGVRRVPYRLPEVLEAVARRQTVYITEGEKDAEALRSVGKIATCNPGGAGKWRPEYAQHFAGARVIIVADRDEPGRKHAQKVKESLSGVAREVYVVEALRGKDAHDHLVENGLLVKEFQQVHLAPKKSIITSVKDFALSVPDYDENKDYLGPFLHGGYRIHVAGPTGHGKTSFLLEAESAALRGDDFLGWRGRGNLRVLHIDLEMPGELLLQAVKDARLYGADGFDILHLPDGLEIDTNDEHRRLLEDSVKGYDIVTIDPWYKLVGNELEYSKARYVVGLLDRLRDQHKGMCMLVGFHTHEPYSAKDRLSLATISGFKFFHRPADIILTFQRTKGNISRLLWAKNRSPRLGVAIDDEWTLEWSRGRGFQRVYEAGDSYLPGVFGQTA